MRMMISLAAVAVTLATAAPAAANLWRLASDAGSTPNRSHFYVDIDSVRRTGDIVDFTTMSVYETTTADRDYDRSVIQRRGNCATMSSQMLVTKFYAGSSLLESNTTPGNWITHKDGSIIYGTLMAACGKRAYRGDPIADPVSRSRSIFGSYSPAPSTSSSSGKNTH